MRIDRVEATAFGPLAEAVLEFAPGMTVVHGRNEAGKSTWHAALYAGLCGMRRGAGLRREDREFRERYRPWEGDAWGTGVRVILDAGRTIELHHDLDGRIDCSATDMTTAKDVSDAIMFDGSPDGSRFLGLNRQTFLNTVCVRQTETLAVLREAESLQEQLQRAAATSGRDSTAEAALRRLGEFRKEQVGTGRSTSTKPLRRAMDAETTSRVELASAEQAHDEYLELVRERDRQLEEVRDLEGRLHAATQALARRELDDLRGRVDRIRRLALGFPDGPPLELADDDALAEAVTEALTRFEGRPDEPVEPDGPSAAELEATIAALPPEPDGDLEPHDDVVAAERAWLLARERLEAHDERRPADADPSATCSPRAHELRQAADDLEVIAPPVDEVLETRVRELEAGPGPSPPSRALLAVGAALVVIGLGLLFVLPPAVGAVLATAGIGVVGVAFLRRPATSLDTGQLARLQAKLSFQQAAADQAETRRAGARERCAAWGVDPDPETLRRLARSVETADDAAHRLAEWQHQRSILADRAETAARQVREVLHDRGETPEAEDVGELVELYRVACRARAVQHAEAERRTVLTSELGRRREGDAQREADTTARAEAERQLRDVASTVGIADDDPGRVTARLRIWQAERSARRRDQQKDLQKWARLQEALDGRTLDELEEELRVHEERLDDVMPADPVEADVDLLERMAEELTAELRAARTAADELGGQVHERERALPSVAEAEENLGRASAELARVRALEETLTLTSSFLEAARDRVHRDIAPVLATAVTDRLPRITANRYTEAIVDPASLDVLVRAPDGQMRPASLLSQGTAEQVYLLLRLAMAEHLVTTDESAPFILDDALVQTDSVRAAAILDLLHEISDERQVIVFSQEDDVLTWAEDHLDGEQDRLVLLPAP